MKEVIVNWVKTTSTVIEVPDGLTPLEEHEFIHNSCPPEHDMFCDPYIKDWEHY